MRPALSVLAVVLAACGSAGLPRPDAGIDGGGPSDSGEASDAGVAYQGYVDLISASSGGTTFYGFTASLFPSQAGGPFCAQGVLVGSCCLQVYASSDGGILPAESAGELTISNPDSGESMELGWDPQSQSYGAPAGFVSWGPGSTLRVSAAGGTVQAFSAQAVAPQPISGLPADAGALPVSLSAPWRLGWDGTDASFMEVALGGSAGLVTCRAPDNAGTATIPAALVGQVSDGGTGFAVATRVGAGLAVTGNATVEVRVKVSAVSDVAFTP